MSEPDQGPAQESAKDAGQERQKEQLPDADSGFGVNEALEAFIGVILLGVGQMIGEDFPDVALCISGVGIAFLVHLFKLRCQKRWGRKVWFWRGEVGINAIIAVLVVIILFVRHRPQPSPLTPDFKLWLALAESPNVVVGLTNNIPKGSIEDIVAKGKTIPILMIPRREGQSVFDLQFRVLNSSEVLAEEVEVLVEYSSQLTRIPKPQWREFKRLNAPKTPTNFPPNVQVASMNGAISWPFTLLPHRGTDLPVFTISNSPIIKDGKYLNATLHITAQSKTSRPFGFLFPVAFVPVKNEWPTNLFWGGGTVGSNGNFIISFRRSNGVKPRQNSN